MRGGGDFKEFDIKAKIWLEKDGEPVFGLGRFLLLEKIESSGSISSAAKELGYSYKKAWSFINLMEKRFGFELVSKKIGGRYGAGKTTTIKILCTLVRQTSGYAYINGYNTLTDPKEVRKSIGLVFQDPTLDNDLSAYENLNFHAKLYGMNKSAIKDRIDYILNFIDLYGY